MKIAVFSDMHFGFAHRPDLEDDTFDNADEAMEKALDADLILILGDIFDSRLPKTNTWAKAMKILTKPLMKENRGIKLIHSTKEIKEISQRTLSHIPVVALHGTHERRGRGEPNAIDVLENAGILIHLHCDTIIFEKDGVKVAVHGMSGVPERFASDILSQWNPQPAEGCFNILLLHQSIDPYVYSPLEPPSIAVSNLPKGFDMIIDGHIHQHNQIMLGDTTLVFAGSTVVTQFEKLEAEVEKGVYFISLNNNVKTEFVPLKNYRKFFYEEIFIEEGTAKNQIDERIEEILSSGFQKPPIIRMKIYGKKAEIFDQDLRELERKYFGKAILIFAKEVESPEIAIKTEFLRALREEKLSVEDMGLELLKKNLDEFGFSPMIDYEQVFKLLGEGEVEKTFDILVGGQKTLEGILKTSSGDANDIKS
jgi:DNA repair exonuclease SbcCD nuclease subunit